MLSMVRWAARRLSIQRLYLQFEAVPAVAWREILETQRCHPTPSIIPVQGLSNRMFLEAIC